MLYQEFINKAIDLTVIHEDECWYLIPWYRKCLIENDLTIDKISDWPNVTEEDVYEELKMFVEMQRERHDKSKKLLFIITEMLDEVIEPEKLSIENEFVKNVLEYMKEAKNKNSISQNFSIAKKNDVE